MKMFKLLSEIQQNLKAPKSQNNNFGKYKYRSCEDIVEAVKTCMPRGSILTISDELVLIGERYYIKATATLAGEEGDPISSIGFAREALSKKGMDESQITGAASSYARKYALNGLFAIDDTKDSDHTNKGQTKTPEAKNAPANIKELNEFKKAVWEYSNLVGLTHVEVLKNEFSVDVESLSEKSIDDLKDMLNRVDELSARPANSN